VAAIAPHCYDVLWNTITRNCGRCSDRRGSSRRRDVRTESGGAGDVGTIVLAEPLLPSPHIAQRRRRRRHNYQSKLSKENDRVWPRLLLYLTLDGGRQFDRTQAIRSECSGLENQEEWREVKIRIRRLVIFFRVCTDMEKCAECDWCN
jgi:hypothetical protein